MARMVVLLCKTMYNKRITFIKNMYKTEPLTSASCCVCCRPSIEEADEGEPADAAAMARMVVLLCKTMYNKRITFIRNMYKTEPLTSASCCVCCRRSIEEADEGEPADAAAMARMVALVAQRGGELDTALEQVRGNVFVTLRAWWCCKAGSCGCGAQASHSCTRLLQQLWCLH
jgi:diadenosine tetraphosphate (Ap4A) HIT family hydrolase